MDKFIVRFSVLALNVYMIVALAYAINGIDISEYDYIFTDSLIIGIVLTTLVHVQGRYHCKWIRALCYNLNIVPSINFIDCKYPLFETAEGYILCNFNNFYFYYCYYYPRNKTFHKSKKIKEKTI